VRTRGGRGSRNFATWCARPSPVLLVLAAALALLMTACDGGAGRTGGTETEAPVTAEGDAGRQAFPEGSVPAVLVADGRFATFLELLRDDAPSLVGFMANERFNGTVFAPTEAAFETLAPEVLQDLRDREVSPGRSALVVMLQHHTVAGQWPSSELMRLEAVGPGETEPVGGHGYPVEIRVQRGDIKVDGATVVEPDIQASNGLIHAIDGVMIPAALTDMASG
jgi:uncharacterized surface protein with fasciclin (FAS1) repeats